MKQRSQEGFTLVEIMVVTLFLAIIGTYTWQYLRTTFNTQTAIEHKTSIQQTGISIISRLTDDLTQVFFVDSYQHLTMFKGTANELTFSSLSHDAANPTDRESDEAKITYALEDDKDSKTQSKALTRKEVPYFTLNTEKDEGYEPLVVAHGIKDIDFKYSIDGQKFVNEWDALGPDHLNKLPKLVKIGVTVVDDGGSEEYFETLVNLPMTDDMNAQVAKTTTTGTSTTGTGTTTGTPGTTGTTSATPTTNTTTQPQGTTNATP